MNRDTLLVYIGSLLISFAYGISFSIPLFIERMGANEVTTGWVFAIYGCGTLIAVLISKFLFKKIEPKNIASLGALSYALGSLGFLSITHINILIFCYPLFLGFGWGFFYNAAPYMLSMFAHDNNRSTLFSYLSAFTMLGSGCAPVLIRGIWGNEINFNIIFLAAALICIASCIIFNSINVVISTTDFREKSALELKIITAQRSREYLVIFPLLMVFLGACVVTVLLNFQTTFANLNGMNYASFFIIYSLVVVGSRLALGSMLAKLNQYYLSVSLLILMSVSLLGFQISINNVYLYNLNAALFAFSYGLVYPTIQAIAVNLTMENKPSNTLSYFSLLYFIGLYGFPVGAGFFIVHFGYQNTILIITVLSIIELSLGIILCRAITKKSHKYEVVLE